MSLSDTIYNCILLGDKNETKLKSDFKVPDKRYWWIKISALAKLDRWDKLEKFSKTKSPVGYRPFVEACMARGNNIEALKYIPRVTDSWEKEGDAATASLPKFYVQDQGMQSNYYRDSDQRTWKLNYLCLREVKLSYDLPRNWLTRSGINSVNIFVAGNTLAYFTKERHAREINPEWGTTNTYDAGAGYPAVRKFNFGLRVAL